MAIEEFTINVLDATLQDLHRRFDTTRWPDELENVNWEIGSKLGYSKSLADYWRDGYWHPQHEAPQALPQCHC